MQPVIPLKWSESSIYPGPANLASLIQQRKVKVIRGGLVAMSESDHEAEVKSARSYTLSLDLTDNRGPQSLDVDTVIFATGWRTGDYTFFNRDQLDELGLPVYHSEEKPPPRELAFAQTDRLASARLERDILSMSDTPSLWQESDYSARSIGRVKQAVAPYRLFRLLAPMSHLYDRDVVFPGELYGDVPFIARLMNAAVHVI